MTPPYISRVHLKEWRCFRDIDIRLQPGINVVIGRNNVGKSALLDVLALSASTDEIHAEFDLTAPGFDIFEAFGGLVPEPTASWKTKHQLVNLNVALTWIANQPDHVFRAFFDARSQAFDWYGSNVATYAVYQDPGGNVNALASDKVAGGRQFHHQRLGNSREFKRLADFQSRVERTFLFRPDRILPGTSALSVDGKMDTHGENIAGVIQNLEGRKELPAFLELIQKVFPEIRNIGARAADANRVEVFLWHEENDWRSGVRLSDSGRGVAPVLAILYALHYHSDKSCMILIDEPQAFLHANALHRLLDVFRQYPQHQFVLATHSPIVVTAPGVNECVLLTQVRGITCARNLGRPDVAAAQSILAEVGSSHRDVFGADAVVWVEGPTEEACFPLILAQNGVPTRGIVILPIRSTDELLKQKSDAIDVYLRLARANALCPPVVAFQLDRENRKPAVIEEYERRFKGGVFFTKRRMYENYLLHPGAVAYLIRRLDSNSEVTAEDVERAFSGCIEEKDGVDACHGADVLKTVVKTLTDQKCEYRKVEHGPVLTKWLLENEPSALEEIKAILVDIFPGG